jgi:hypothetical protein
MVRSRNTLVERITFHHASNHSLTTRVIIRVFSRSNHPPQLLGIKPKVEVDFELELEFQISLGFGFGVSFGECFCICIKLRPRNTERTGFTRYRYRRGDCPVEESATFDSYAGVGGSGCSTRVFVV